DALAPVTERHAADLAAFDAEVEEYGMRGTAGRRRALVARHKRIERASRTGELRLGCTLLARAYLDAAATASAPAAMLRAVERIGAASDALALTPNEELALVALVWDLPVLAEP